MKMKTKQLLWLAAVVPLAGLRLLCWFIDHRVYDLERQDKGELEGKYTHEEYVDMMHILSEANVADPNGYNATLDIIERHYPPHSDAHKIQSIVEIGFGLGHFSVLLAGRYPSASVVGIDAHQFSVDAANEYLSHLASKSLLPKNVRFELRTESELASMKNTFDLVTTNLVNHHIFPDEAFVEFLKQVAIVGKKAFIFNDFHRTAGCILANDVMFSAVRYIGLENIVAVTNKLKGLLPFIDVDGVNRYRNIMNSSRPGIDLVVDGGMLSMRRSFSLSEYKTMFQRAGYPDNSLQCYRLDRRYNLQDTCRAICVADLSWNTDKTWPNLE
jgi:hypothetical protein